MDKESIKRMVSYVIDRNLKVLSMLRDAQYKDYISAHDKPISATGILNQGELWLSMDLEDVLQDKFIPIFKFLQKIIKCTKITEQRKHFMSFYLIQTMG